jgi:class 3 adenylate cyclase
MRAPVALPGGDCDRCGLTGGHSNEASIFDAAANLALRLHSIASPGSVVIDATTRNLVGDLFMYQDLGLSELAAHPEPGSAGPVTGAYVRSRTG